MYAVIRAGGKQYRVAPGDVLKIERTAGNGADVDFEVLAVSAGDGKVSSPEGARVVGQVLGEGRADKILVFHFKRKKQYKKLNGHRQGFTQVRIAEIFFDGQKFLAPELPAKKVKAAPVAKAETSGKGAAGKTTGRKTSAKKSAAKKSTK